MAGQETKDQQPANKRAEASTDNIYEAAKLTPDEDLAQLHIAEIIPLLCHRENIPDEQLIAKHDAAIATLAEINPRDGKERMLAMQMIGCHEAAMECLHRAMLNGQTLKGRDVNLKHAEKLMATYTNLLDSLNKNRGKGQQKVTVEHVHVEAGGQAIVGNVDGRPSSESLQKAPRAIAHDPAQPVELIAKPTDDGSPDHASKAEQNRADNNDRRRTRSKARAGQTTESGNDS